MALEMNRWVHST